MRQAIAADEAQHAGRLDSAERRVANPATALGEDRRRHVAEAQTRTPYPSGALDAGAGGAELALELGTEPLRSLHPAGDVVADVNHCRGSGLQGEQGVEAGHAEGFRRRHVEASADVSECARRDPSHAGLDRVKRREQQVAPQAGLVAAAGYVAFQLRSALTALPS